MMLANWISYIIWIAFAIVSGLIESFYYSAVYKNKMKRFASDHAIFTVIRGVVAAPLLLFTFGWSWQFFVGGFLLMIAFPFWHDGVYYQIRHWLDGVYPKGFTDHTTTSDAKFNIDFTTRSTMFLFSIIYIFLSYE